MAKKWYHYLVTHEAGAAATSAGDGAESPSTESVADIAAAIPADMPMAEVSSSPSFEEIYAAARIEPPAHGYSILKVADMLRSEHIVALPADIKRKSVLLALDAAGVAVQDVIQDAVRRDRALDTFERTQQKALETLEARLREDSARLQQEIDALIADKQTKIRIANEELAREAAAVAAWRERKQTEEARIADAVGQFAADNPITTGPVSASPASKQ